MAANSDNENARGAANPAAAPADAGDSAEAPTSQAPAAPAAVPADDGGRGWKTRVTVGGVIIAVAVILLTGRLWGAESTANREADQRQTMSRPAAPASDGVAPTPSYDENGVETSPAPAPAPSASADADAVAPGDNSNILPTIVGTDEAHR